MTRLPRSSRVETHAHARQGGVYQQACSAVTETPTDAYQHDGGGFSTVSLIRDPDNVLARDSDLKGFLSPRASTDGSRTLENPMDTSRGKRTANHRGRSTLERSDRTRGAASDNV